LRQIVGDRATVETISDIAGFEALRDEWRELLAESDSDSLFLTWEWAFTWWKYLSAGRRLQIVTVRHGGLLVGIAPLSLGLRLLGIVGAPTLEFLGSGNVGSDYLDLVARRGHEQLVAREVARRAARLGVLLRLSRIRRRRPVAAALRMELRRRGWSVIDSHIDVAPAIPLAGHTWESYLRMLGREHRYAVRRKLRLVTRNHEVELVRARTQEQRRAMLSVLIRLHHARWRERGGSDAFHTPDLVAFHEEFSRTALERDWLRLYLLRLDGEPAAAFYGFRYGDTMSFYQAGFDPRFARLSPGMVCLALVIQQAMAEGAATFDLLHGAETYKLHWARGIQMLGRLEVFPPHARGALWRKAFSLGRSTREAARRLLGTG
jgi:CelD/BcsL family acetyltransferase involved in cellulose biosynthesis